MYVFERMLMFAVRLKNKNNIGADFDATRGR